MKKIFSILFLGVIFTMFCFGCKKHDNVYEVFCESSSINIVKEGEVASFDKGIDQYYSILFEFEKMIEGSHQMPAFAVSIDEDTRRELSKGLWIEFVFLETNITSDLPFDKLLIKVEKDYGGFNIIREYEGKYEGRCFYLNLDNKDMSEFYLYLINDKNLWK